MFVDNITTGANAVLRSFPFDTRRRDRRHQPRLRRRRRTRRPTCPHDRRHAAHDRAAAARRGSVATTSRPSPPGSASAHACSSSTTSPPAPRMILPLAEIAALCHERGVLVLADGAHVPGNIAVDIDSFGVDWYVANLHKWAWAPRSAGLLWSAKEHQGYLHPTVISWGLDHGIAAEFDLLGTRDPSHVPRRAVRHRVAERVRRRRGRGRDLPLQPRPRLVGRPVPGRSVGHALHDARGDDRLDGQRSPSRRVRHDR